MADHDAALRLTFEMFAEAGGHLDDARPGRGRAPGGARRPRPVPADGGRRRAGGQARGARSACAAAQSARRARHRGGPQDPARPAAHRGVRHRVLPRPAGGGGHLRDRPRDRPSSGGSGATAFTARRTSTSASRPRSSSAWTAATLNQIVLHLGNGASASAIVGGRPVDTSMGLTPMEGLVMGTRSGDVDPGIVFYLARTAQMSVEDIETMLNRRSGVFGLGGENDFRELHKRIENGDAAATIGLRRVHPPVAQVHRRVPGGAGQHRCHHLHRGGGGERRDGASRRADRAGAAGHRTRRTPQRQPGQRMPG